MDDGQDILVPYLYIKKINNKARIPTKRVEDGCFDLYGIYENECEIINPNEIKSISTGLMIKFPHNWIFRIFDRSSVALKGLQTIGGVIDSGYRGEVKILLNNCSNKTILITNLKKEEIVEKYSEELKKKEVNIDKVEIYPQDKAIAQFILLYTPHIELKIKEEIELDSERKTGGFGSTNK